MKKSDLVKIIVSEVDGVTAEKAGKIFKFGALFFDVLPQLGQFAGN